MRWALAATVVFLLGLATPGAAQDNQFGPELVIGVPALAGGQLVPVEATGVALEVPWTYTFPAAAAQPSGSTTIVWTLTCPKVASEPVSTTVAFAPGQQEYTGTASIPVSATRAAPGLGKERCTVAGEAGGAVESLQAADTAETDLSIAYYGNVTVSALVGDRQAGPQKQIHYPILIENRGNARTQVVFEVVGDVGGGWNILLPTAMVLESPTTGLAPTSETAIVTVSTPFDNGPNSGSMEFVVRVRTQAADDPDAQGPAVDVPLKASVDGLYIPGPPLALLLATLAAAALARTRPETPR